MPFLWVQRDKEGTIVGFSTLPPMKWGYAPKWNPTIPAKQNERAKALIGGGMPEAEAFTQACEEIPDELLNPEDLQPRYDRMSDKHPDFLAYWKKNERFAKPPPRLTADELSRMRREEEEINQEGMALNNAILVHGQVWVQLEIGLSAMFHEILNVQPPGSHVAYAIYYSPTSIEARLSIVDNSILQLAEENTAFDALLGPWREILDLIKKAIVVRNKVAHGAPLVVAVRGRQSVRLSSPAFDIIRVGRKLAKGSDHGLSAKQLSESNKTVDRLMECINELTRYVLAVRQDDTAILPGTLQSLTRRLTTIHDP